VPIATFPNPNGLTHVNGTVYDENEAAGNYNLRLPGQGNAGSIVANALEQSTTDTSEEFNKMIIAQQAYSSAAQVVSTVDEMFQELISAVR
jgi:flagellar hook protein FlgE